MLISIGSTILVLGVLIFIHELGHFLCAKFSGVLVEKFSIGFGPEIFKFKWKETLYAVSLIPLGGFVKMGGETFEDRKGEELQPTDYMAQSPIKRFFILFAGPFMNYFLAYVLLVVVFLAGAPTLAPSIGEILPDSPAARHGILPGDRIISINQTKVDSWIDMTALIEDSEGKEMAFDIDRQGTVVHLSFAADKVERKDVFGDLQTTYQVGIASSGEVIYEQLAPWEAIRGAHVALLDLTGLTLKSLYRLVTGRLSLKVMSGPLGIIDMASKTAKQGLIPLLQLTAYLSVFLAIFNLLPFPALDGGHLFFLLLEVLFKRPVSFSIQERFSQVGFMLLMVLMVVVLYNDMDRFGWVDKVKGIFFP